MACFGKLSCDEREALLKKQRSNLIEADETMIAPNVIIIDSDFHKLWPPEDRFLGTRHENDVEVIIGKHVWVGMNSIVLKGSVIGDIQLWLRGVWSAVLFLPVSLWLGYLRKSFASSLREKGVKIAICSTLSRGFFNSEAQEL